MVEWVLGRIPKTEEAYFQNHISLLLILRFFRGVPPQTSQGYKIKLFYPLLPPQVPQKCLQNRRHKPRVNKPVQQKKAEAPSQAPAEEGKKSSGRRPNYRHRRRPNKPSGEKKAEG